MKLEDIKVWDIFYYLLINWNEHNFNQAEVINIYKSKEYGREIVKYVLQRDHWSIVLTDKDLVRDYLNTSFTSKEDAIQNAIERIESEINAKKCRIKEQEIMLSYIMENLVNK